MLNRLWADTRKVYPAENRLALFIGEPEDVPDTGLGPFLPCRRALANATMEFVGYVFPFDPAEFGDRKEIRAGLGYGDEPLIVCSIGGTAIGKELLTQCGQAYAHPAKENPGLRMILVCGPRLDPESVDVPQGVEIRGYVPRLYEHFAASDLAIVQAGATATLELTALRRPFLFFPWSSIMNSRSPWRSGWHGTGPECACRSPRRRSIRWPTPL